VRLAPSLRHQAVLVATLALLALAPAPGSANQGKRVVIRAGGGERTVEVGTKISNGAFCNGYRGHDLATLEPVAIKIMRGDRAAEGVADTFDKEHRVLDAARAPALTRTHGIGATVESEPRRALVLELANGHRLGVPYGRWMPRPIGKSVRIALRLAEGVEALERAGWRHNDIHPGNIHIDGDRSASVKLLDLGNATSAEEGSRKTNPFYNADDHGPPNVNGDVYSVAAVLIHLLTGRHGLDALAEIPATTAVVDGRRVSLRDVIARAVHSDPLQRFQQARELIHALQPFAAGP
jgi:serine/threonine-protein kinase